LLSESKERTAGIRTEPNNELEYLSLGCDDFLSYKKIVVRRRTVDS